MINHYNPIVAPMFVAYIILSLASTPFFLGYGVYKVVNKIKTRRNNHGK